MEILYMDVNGKTLRAVIAIDFGTSRSGYAYAFIKEEDPERASKEEPQPNFDWPEQPIPSEKTATYLLYSPEKCVEAWGYVARQRLAQLRWKDRAKSREYHFFSNFKMALHEKKTESRDGPSLTIKDGQRILTVDTQEFLVIDLIADFLSHIKEYALENLGKQTAGIIWEDEILWCLTIPAIWTDTDKKMMREAARKAGLISSDKSDAERLLLVLEPEAAAVRCLEYEASISSEMTPGTCFMVIDAGGGTVDITVHKVVETMGSKELALEEVASGTGDSSGSIYVDRRFQGYLRRKFTDQIWQDFHDNEPLAFLEMIDSWEQAKCYFDPRKKPVTNIRIHTSLYKMLPKSILDNLIKEQDDDTIIPLTSGMMEDLFRPALEGIVRQVEEQFRRLDKKKCDFIFLVGGFAQSLLLQERIKEKFGPRVKKVVVPDRPGAAVLLGAASFGLDPSVIRSRRSRLTYGIEISDAFDPSIDPEGKKFDDPRGGFLCRNRFFIFVQSGESVAIDRAVQNICYPLYEDQKSITLSCYSTERKTARYTDGLSKVGEFTISREDIANGYDWPVEVTMFFGKTEIKVVARDLKTGKTENIELSFSSTYFQEFLIRDDDARKIVIDGNS